MVMSGHLKYDEPEVEIMSHKDHYISAYVNDRASYVLSYGQPLA